MPAKNHSDSRPSGTIRRTLTILALLLLVLAAWQLRMLILLGFAAVLVAVLLTTVSALVQKATRLPEGASYAAAVTAIVILLVAAGWLFGSVVFAQAQQLATDIPAAWQGLRQQLESFGWGQALLEHVSNMPINGSRILSGTGAVAVMLVTLAGYLILVLFGGFFLGLQPGLYKRGALLLVPGVHQQQARETLDACGRGLRLWLLGQLAAMAAVGILTGGGLWLAGVPNAFTLGLFAGLADFVPFVGPVVAAVPGLLVASTVDFSTVLWTLLVYVIVQQIEGNIILPLVERRVVALPQALLVFSVVAFGILFGFMGVLLATPLTVVAYIAINKLYVCDALGHEPKSDKLKRLLR